MESVATNFNLVQELLKLTLFGTEWVLWLLVGLSILSLAVIIERSYYFYCRRINIKEFTSHLVEDFTSDDLERVKQFCEKRERCLESKVALEAIRVKEHDLATIEQSMNAVIMTEKNSLDKGLSILGTLGSNAPFIGLFGTVLGIIVAFHALSKNPLGGASVVMTGISEALVATAVGLVVAIPAVIAFNVFQRAIKVKIGNAQTVVKVITSQLMLKQKI